MFTKLWDRIVDHFEDYEIKKEDILHKITFLLILIVGFIVRIFSVIKGYDPLIKAFDPYVQLVSATYINDHGFISFIHWFKTDTWYPFGFKIGQELYWGVPLSGVLLKWILGIMSINVTMQQAAYYSPVIYGVLTIIASYYLGKEVNSPSTGLFTAFFMSISPAFLSRSVAGFYDNESVGILFTILALYFFIKSMKTGSTSSAVLGGISLALLMGSWGAYRYILDLLPIVVFFLAIFRKLNYKVVKSYTLTITIALSIGFIVQRVLRNGFFNLEIMLPLFMTMFIILVSMIQNLSRNLSEKIFKRVIIVGAIVVFLVIAVAIILLVVFGVFQNVADKFWAVILPSGRSAIPIISSVSEQQPMSWAELFNNIHIMTFFIPLGLYYCIKKPSQVNITVLIYGVTAVYFSGSMIRLALILAPAASLLSALAIDKLLFPYALSAHGKIALTKRKLRVVKSIGRDEAIIAYVVIAGLLTTFIFHSVGVAKNFAQSEMAPVVNSANQMPLTDWQEALLWLRNNANNEGIVKNSPSVVLSWWDYGDWISIYGNATTLVDNTTTNKTQIGIVGTMLMWNFTEAVKLMYRYNVRYVLINSQAGYTGLGSDLGKALWPIRIAESTVPQYGINETNYYSYDSTHKGSIYQEPFYKSVLYRLAAYDPQTGFAFPPKGPQESQQGTFVLMKNYPVKTLQGDDGVVYFREVFRSFGLGGLSEARQYPTVRIYEVIYPQNIAQLSAELSYLYPKA